MSLIMRSRMLAGLAVAAAWTACAAERRPNILIVLADDLGYSVPGYTGIWPVWASLCWQRRRG